MNKVWQLGKKRRSLPGLASFPGTIAGIGLLLGLLLFVSEDLRRHPVARWTPLLILALLIPFVILLVRSELSGGAQRSLFRLKEGELTYETARFKSIVLRVQSLKMQGDEYLLVFTDEQERQREVSISAETPDLGSLLSQIRKIEDSRRK